MCAMLESAGSFLNVGETEAWLAKKAPEDDPEDEDLEDDLEDDEEDDVEDEWGDEVDDVDDSDLDRLPLGGQPLARIERAAIKQTLALTGGMKARAAQSLGIAVSTLYDKLKKYEL